MRKFKLIGLFLSMILITYLVFRIVSGGQASQLPDDEMTKVKPNKTQVRSDSDSEQVELPKFTVVIDPGHGGRDGGALGMNGTIEKDVTLRTAQEIKALLERHDVNVVLSRSGDTYVDLSDRVKIATDVQADLFISIHYDGFESSSVHGITSYYYHEEDAEIAGLIHNKLMARQIDVKDRGYLHGNYYVLRENEVPSVLLELGYITNPDDEARMNSDTFQADVAKAIEEVVVKMQDADSLVQDIDYEPDYN